MESWTAAKLMQAGLRGRPADACEYLMFRLDLRPLRCLVIGTHVGNNVATGDTRHFIRRSAALLRVAVFGYYLPPLMLKNQIDKRKVDIGRAWPDAVDSAVDLCRDGHVDRARVQTHCSGNGGDVA